MLAISACGQKSEPDDSAPVPLCADDFEYEPFLRGMSKTAENHLEIRLVDAEPMPPRVGDNTWQIEVLDDEGKGMEGVALSERRFMPAHGHAGIRVVELIDQEAGRYLMEGINFFMPGVWEVRIIAPPPPLKESGNLDEDSVVFAFCIQ